MTDPLSSTTPPPQRQRDPDARTASEILFDALADFNQSEATAVVILYTNDAGDLCIKSNAVYSSGIGMCHYGREMFVRKLFGEGTGDR